MRQTDKETKIAKGRGQYVNTMRHINTINQKDFENKNFNQKDSAKEERQYTNTMRQVNTINQKDFESKESFTAKNSAKERTTNTMRYINTTNQKDFKNEKSFTANNIQEVSEMLHKQFRDVIELLNIDSSGRFYVADPEVIYAVGRKELEERRIYKDRNQLIKAIKKYISRGHIVYLVKLSKPALLKLNEVDNLEEVIAEYYDAYAMPKPNTGLKGILVTVNKVIDPSKTHTEDNTRIDKDFVFAYDLDVLASKVIVKKLIQNLTNVEFRNKYGIIDTELWLSASNRLHLYIRVKPEIYAQFFHPTADGKIYSGKEFKEFAEQLKLFKVALLKLILTGTDTKVDWSLKGVLDKVKELQWLVWMEGAYHPEKQGASVKLFSLKSKMFNKEAYSELLDEPTYYIRTPFEAIMQTDELLSLLYSAHNKKGKNSKKTLFDTDVLVKLYGKLAKGEITKKDFEKMIRAYGRYTNDKELLRELKGVNADELTTEEPKTSFIADAANKRLPSVNWIDLIDTAYTMYDTFANDKDLVKLLKYRLMAAYVRYYRSSHAAYRINSLTGARFNKFVLPAIASFKYLLTESPLLAGDEIDEATREAYLQRLIDTLIEVVPDKEEDIVQRHRYIKPNGNYLYHEGASKIVYWIKRAAFTGRIAHLQLIKLLYVARAAGIDVKEFLRYVVENKPIPKEFAKRFKEKYIEMFNVPPQSVYQQLRRLPKLLAMSYAELVAEKEDNYDKSLDDNIIQMTIDYLKTYDENILQIMEQMYKRCKENEKNCKLLIRGTKNKPDGDDNGGGGKAKSAADEKQEEPTEEEEKQQALKRAQFGQKIRQANAVKRAGKYAAYTLQFTTRGKLSGRFKREYSLKEKRTKYIVEICKHDTNLTIDDILNEFREHFKKASTVLYRFFSDLLSEEFIQSIPRRLEIRILNADGKYEYIRPAEILPTEIFESDLQYLQKLVDEGYYKKSSKQQKVELDEADLLFGDDYTEKTRRAFNSPYSVSDDIFEAYDEYLSDLNSSNSNSNSSNSTNIIDADIVDFLADGNNTNNNGAINNNSANTNDNKPKVKPETGDELFEDIMRYAEEFIKKQEKEKSAKENEKQDKEDDIDILAMIEQMSSEEFFEFLSKDEPVVVNQAYLDYDPELKDKSMDEILEIVLEECNRIVEEAKQEKANNEDKQ